MYVSLCCTPNPSMPLTGGAGLTTYRELCSLANEMGQPDLIYR